MDYREVKFNNPPEMNELIIAWLGETDFEMFEERADGLNAYIQEDKFNVEDVQSMIARIEGNENITFTVSLIKDRNWNKEWESNFEPVSIAGEVLIRAPFHQAQKEFRYEIIIEPKMSFGTGHHATTAMMIEMMLSLDFKNKIVLDMGCGSGVLAILAAKLGAMQITAIDFDQWAYENCIENCERNNVKRILVSKGTAAAIPGLRFDIILANINRNVLLADTSVYSSSLNRGGYLLLSGFLAEDEPLLKTVAAENDLHYVHALHKEKWSAMTFEKK